MKFMLMLAGMAVGIQAVSQTDQLKPAFTLKESPAIIEGMTFDPVDKNFYFGESLNKRILKYSKAGKSLGYIDGKKDGMTSILGMTVFPKTHHLWVCGAIDEGEQKIMCLFQYDMNTGKLISKYPDTSKKAQLFNDITITENGGVYATDTYIGAVYTIDTCNSYSVRYMQSDSLRDANGITSFGNMVFVSTSRGFAKFDTENKRLSKINLDDYLIAGNDGLYYYKNSLIGIQNVFFPVTVGRYYLDDQQRKIQRAKVLVSGHPSLVIPTTGTVVEDDFYFMSNTNLGTEDPSSPGKANNDKIRPVTVVRIPLNAS